MIGSFFIRPFSDTFITVHVALRLMRPLSEDSRHKCSTLVGYLMNSLPLIGASSANIRRYYNFPKRRSQRLRRDDRTGQSNWAVDQEWEHVAILSTLN